MPGWLASQLLGAAGLLLVGVDPNQEYAWVLSRDKAPALNIRDLADVIRANQFSAV